MMIIIALLIKFTYLLKIHMKQNINILSKNVKKKNGLENLKDFNTFTEYSNNIQDVYKSFEDFNPTRKCIYRIC